MLFPAKVLEIQMKGVICIYDCQKTVILLPVGVCISTSQASLDRQSDIFFTFLIIEMLLK